MKAPEVSQPGIGASRDPDQCEGSLFLHALRSCGHLWKAIPRLTAASSPCAGSTPAARISPSAAGPAAASLGMRIY
jgi:hypothetical protein